MKSTQNHNNYRNRLRKGATRLSNLTLLTGLIGLVNFGYQITAGYLSKLITVGCTPFENLNRGQARKMWWLFAMYRPC
jgi:hypothetical protein